MFKKWLLNAVFVGWLEATEFRTTGGTSSEFVKGDGSLDDTEYANIDHNHDSSYMKLYNSTSTSDYNSVVGNGIWRMQGSTNAPFGAAHTTMFQAFQSNSGSYGWQLAIEDGGNAAFRYKGNVWDDQWYKLWHNGNLSNVSQLNNDAGYVTANNYANAIDFNENNGYLYLSRDGISTQLSTSLDGRYALISQIPTNNNQLANGAGYLTEHQDISHLATQTDLDDTNAAVDSLEDTIAEAELDILELQQNVVHKTGDEVIYDEKVFEHIVMEGGNNNSVYEYSIPKEDELYSAELFSFGVINPEVVNYEVVMYMKGEWYPAEFIKEELCNGLLGLHVNGVVIRRGYVRNNVVYEHLVSGEILYLEDVGGISTSPPPVGSSLVRRIVGYSLEKGVINFDPSHEWSVQ